MTAGRSERFSRFRLIEWWDQKKLSRARVVVVGAGALGNELLKNLALLGIGNVLIIDDDTIEESNLPRSILFRTSDVGKSKARVAARALKRIYPGVTSHAIEGNVITDVGLGVFRWADVVMSAVDNRHARVWINGACFRLDKPWIDGGIDRIDGIVRFFTPPEGPCYECTMSDMDWQLLRQRKSCSALAAGDRDAGKVPTTPTTASVVAGIAVQELVKYLHGLEILDGKGFFFNGLTHDSYVIEYARKKDCFAHERAGKVVSMGRTSGETSLDELLGRARRNLGSGAVVEFNNEIISSLSCKKCKRKFQRFLVLEKTAEDAIRCPSCHRTMVFDTFHTVSGDEPFLKRSVRRIGVPPFDIVAGRNETRTVHYEFSKDAAKVLGPLKYGRRR
jgi:adenylyltransferase/sulfurtransferase